MWVREVAVRHHVHVFVIEVWTGDGFEVPALRVVVEGESAARRVFGGCLTFPGDVVTLTGRGVSERRTVTVETASVVPGVARAGRWTMRA